MPCPYSRYGWQASVGAGLDGAAVIDIIVAVGRAARLDLAIITLVAGTALASRSCHAARFLFRAEQDSSKAAFAVSLGATSPD